MAVYTDILKELRKERNISQKQMGKFFGISQAAYSYYESGKRPMRLEMLVDLADILDTSTDYILGRTYVEKPYPKRGRREFPSL